MKTKFTFLELAGVTLVAISTALVLANWGVGHIVQPPEPVFGIGLRVFMWAVAAAQGAMGLWCLFAGEGKAAARRRCCWVIVWIQLQFPLYATAVFASGLVTPLRIGLRPAAAALGLTPPLFIVAAVVVPALLALGAFRELCEARRSADAVVSVVRSAFTLIELLVVMAVIGILAALLLPSLGRAQDKAKATQCLSNERQIGYALRCFADENNGLYPVSGGELTWDLIDNQTHQKGWMQQILGIVKNTNVYRCPADKFSAFSYFNGGRAAWLLASNPAAVDSKRIRYHSAFVLSGDTLWEDRTSWLDADKDDFVQNCIGGPTNGVPFKGWQIHSLGQNVLFEDGHALFYRGYNAAEMTFRYDRMRGWAEAADGPE